MAGKRDREKLRERVKAALEAQGRSQKQLEQALGWAQGTLTRLFAGKRAVDAELLARLAEALDTDVASLVADTVLLGTAEVDAGAPDHAHDEALAEAPTARQPEPVRVAAPVAEPASAPEPVRPEPPPPPFEEFQSKGAPPPVPPELPPPREASRRFRKRDLPLEVLRFLAGRIFGA